MLLLLLACQRPPPAPEGLDASARHLLREFWSDDAIVASGLTGFVRWFDEEGYALVGVDATGANADGFTLGDLAAADIAALDVDDDGRDLAAANGAIGVATFGCDVASAEALLIRGDQAVVFEDFDSYERVFVSDRATFEAGTSDPPPADAPIAPDDDRPDLVLRTDNSLTVSAIGTTLTYPLIRAFRHGRFLERHRAWPLHPTHRTRMGQRSFVANLLVDAMPHSFEWGPVAVASVVAIGLPPFALGFMPLLFARARVRPLA